MKTKKHLILILTAITISKLIFPMMPQKKYRMIIKKYDYKDILNRYKIINQQIQQLSKELSESSKENTQKIIDRLIALYTQYKGLNQYKSQADIELGDYLETLTDETRAQLADNEIILLRDQKLESMKLLNGCNLILEAK